MGDLLITQGGTGTGIDRMDDKTPSAWEEAYGFGLGTGVQTVSGGSGGAGFEFTPNFTPDGATLRIGYTPDADSGSANDKVTAGANGPAGQAWDLTLDLASGVHGVEGLDLFAGYADITMESVNAAHQTGDKEEWTVGANYAIGGLSLGYQYSIEDVATTTADFYENSAYGVSFNINDNFSVSYNNYKSDKNIINAADVELEASSIQLAYTAGGLSVRIAEGEVDNRNYSTAATDDRDGRAISVSLAF